MGCDLMLMKRNMKERADSSSCDLGSERAPAARGQWAGERADAVDDGGVHLDVQHGKSHYRTRPPLLREILIMF
jgi:hypothetical protein